MPHHTHTDRDDNGAPFEGREPTNGDLARMMGATARKLDRIDKFITGGDHPHMGAIVRLDRLEQDAKERRFWTRFAITTGLAGIATAIGGMFKAHS